MTRVLIGDALVNENERLQERINQLIERIEASLKQSFRVAATERRSPKASMRLRVGTGRRLRGRSLASICQEWLPQGAGEALEAQLPVLVS